MISLPSVFSNGALYQQNSVLTIYGYTYANVPVAAELSISKKIISKNQALSDSNGYFGLTLQTPGASFDLYTITVSNENENIKLDNIMFGELWLASGQSNMELSNVFMTDCDEYITTLGTMNIRYFAQEYGDSTFPFNGSDKLQGKWSDSTDLITLKNISAAGTAFMKEIFGFLNNEKETPVGILNASWGGTPIYGWIPRNELLANIIIKNTLQNIGQALTPENWNTAGDCNFQQPSAMYNRKIFPLLGLKIRGIIWYQGEHHCGDEYRLNVYSEYLRCYYSIYKKQFAADIQNFKMISPLLYPWPYGESGETYMGYVNNAFIQCALENPESFAFVPISDLSPVWGFHLNNHPIHPTHKYEVGHRLGMLANVISYGKKGQASPATIRSCISEGDRLTIQFDNTGVGLRIEGKKARGLYISGSDGIYLPAECEVTAPDTLSVSYPFISEPKHAAFAFHSFEPGCNLYAGDYPVAPFKTDRSTLIKIEAKPWMNMEIDSVWVNAMRGDILDMFYHSVWQPCNDSEICYDNAFTLSGRSLRIYSDKTEYGVSVKSYHGNRLALFEFESLRFNLFNNNGLSVSLQCEIHGINDIRNITIQAIKLFDLRGGWSTWELKLDLLNHHEIDKMIFRFKHQNNPYTFVNMESLYLIPKL